MDDKISAMLDRGFILLEAEDWKKAEQIFDKILDAEPHSSAAYLGKSMAELHITDKKSIAQYGKKILKNINFKNFIYKLTLISNYNILPLTVTFERI